MIREEEDAAKWMISFKNLYAKKTMSYHDLTKILAREPKCYITGNINNITDIMNEPKTYCTLGNTGF